MDPQHPLDVAAHRGRRPARRRHPGRRAAARPGCATRWRCPACGPRGRATSARSPCWRRRDRDDLGASGAAPRPRRGPREVLLPLDLGARLGDRVTVAVGDRTVRLRASPGPRAGATRRSWRRRTLARLTEHPGHRRDLGAGRRRGRRRRARTPTCPPSPGRAGPTSTSGLAQRAYVDLQLDVLTAAVVGLLGIAVVIALVGHRQHPGPLGARAGPRARAAAGARADPTPAALDAGRGGGAALGGGHPARHRPGRGLRVGGRADPGARRCSTPPLVLPWGQLLLVVAVAGVAGLLACVLPARRAARVSPAAGLALE